MAIIYKTFKPFRTALYTVLAGFFLLSAPAQAQYGPYVVENVKVDISADNAINARNQAFEKAQQDAFAALAPEFLAPGQLAAFQPPPASVISPMIQDYEVTQEKLSRQRYIGTYTFRFKSASVRNYFGTAASQIVSVVPEDPSQTGPIRPTLQTPTVRNAAPGTILVLPFYQVGQQSFLWSAYNGWMQAWRRTGTLSSQILPLGDLSDIADIGDGEALSYTESGLARMRQRYRAQEVVILVAVPDVSLSQVTADTAPAAGMLRINIYRTDRRDGPEQAGQVVVAANPSETRGDLFDRAARKVQELLQGDWKNTSYVPQVAARNTIEMRVPFANLQEWATAQRTLSRLQGVNDVVLKSLSPREARIGLVYEGTPDTLRIALQQAGMDLSAPTPAVSYGAPVVYDLYLDRRSGAATAPPPSPLYTAPLHSQNRPQGQLAPPPAMAVPDSGPVYDPVPPVANQPYHQRETYTRSF